MVPSGHKGAGGTVLETIIVSYFIENRKLHHIGKKGIQETSKRKGDTKKLVPNIFE